jgi:hypothetical protein
MYGLKNMPTNIEITCRKINPELYAEQYTEYVKCVKKYAKR